MKKFLSLLLCLTLCLTMAGCSAKPDAPAATEAPAVTEAPAATEAPASAAAPDAAAATAPPIPAMEMPEGKLNLPMSFKDYQARYESGLNSFVPNTSITWQDTSDENSRTMTAVVAGAFVGSICSIDEQDNLSQLMLVYQGTLETSDVMNFLTLCAYSGLPLMTSDTVTADNAMNTFMSGVFAVFNNMLGGHEPTGLFGHPVAMQIMPMDDGTYSFFFALDLTRTME